MSKTIASIGTAVFLLSTCATPTSANLLHQPSAIVKDDGTVQKINHRHGFVVVRGAHYYNGFRGVVVTRPGYRFYRGFWFPPEAFATGVIVDRTLARPVPTAGRLTAAHIDWCYAHYRSYRAYDNTFQPYAGPREQCWSPYD